MKKFVVKNKYTFLIAIIIIVLAFSLFNSDKYYPAFYPNPNNLMNSIDGPVVESLEECRNWVYSEAQIRGLSLGEYDYECGVNCDKENSYGLMICEKTVR